MSSPLVVFEGVRRTFEQGRVVALDGIDLHIEAGEFVAVTGPSGSGKSTLLNLMGAMDLASSGTVTIAEQRLTDRRSMETVRRDQIGFVFQMHNLVPVLTAAENIALPMLPRRLPAAERRARCLSLLEQVGLRERADSNVRGLSGGERQRVAIARAMIHEPPLLLADEPTGNLDSKTGTAVMELIHAMRRRSGSALVLVTHNEELCAGCDRWLHLVDGRLSNR